MFWGLIMEPGKKYSQTVEKSFHVSHAALDLDSAHSSPVQVLLGFENRNYLLCTLNKDKWVQVPLDLNFQVGDKVSFATNGPGHVHLTGYLIPDDEFEVGDEESDAEEEEDEEIPELSPINNKKRKGDSQNENKNKKAKSEVAMLLEDTLDDDSDEDDSDVNLSDILDDEAGEEEEDEDEEDDDDEEDENEDEEEEVQQEQPVQKKKKEKPKQNGIVKNQEKQKGDKSPKANKQNDNAKKQEQKGDKSPKANKQNDNAKKQEQKGDKSPKANKQNDSVQKQERKGDKSPTRLKGGVIVEDLKVGEGAPAQNGRQVYVYYEGRLQSNNKVFDATKKGNGFKFRLGKNEVIKGWEIGIAGMKVGGKRKITCPPNMAYGADGSPPVIPPRSTLVFEVELKNVK